MFCFHRANWHSSATLTEFFRAFSSVVRQMPGYVMTREDQQDATIRFLLLTSVSTCFGHHYAHLQENKGPVTAFGVLFCNKRENADTSRDVFFV
jgi:hypothetical protein